MAGHGSPPAEDKGSHPGRQVGRDAWTHYTDVGASLNQQGNRAREAFMPDVATLHHNAASALREHIESTRPTEQPKVKDITAVTGLGTRTLAAAQSHSGDVAFNERMPHTARRMYEMSAAAYGSNVPPRTQEGLRMTDPYKRKAK